MKKDMIIKSLGNKIMEIYAGKKIKGNFYSITPIVQKKDTINHHILLVDVSGSMYSNLGKLKKKLIETLVALKIGGNNYVSVILYSSHGECYRIINSVKCDDVSYKMAQVECVIERELYTRSITVISEPLQHAIDISEELASIAQKHHIVLFTDGCVVPSRWGYKEEENKCYDLAKICKEKGIYLNAIGFGRYYDREFLRTLVELGATGTVNHIDEIPQYYEAVLDMVDKVNDGVLIEVNINNSNFFVTSNSQNYTKPSVIRNFKKNEENIVVVFDEDLVVDGEVIESSDIPVNEDVVADFLYGMTLNHIVYEDVDNAEIVIAQTGDIHAYNSLSNCYSFSEKGQVINELQSLISEPTKRFKEGKHDIKVLSLEEEPICLLEMLQEILLDDKSKLLWDLSYAYKKITQATKSVEDDIKFIYPSVGYAPITSISIGSSKLNINVKADIYSQVINSKTTMKMDAKICREYALVKNGMINVERLWAVLTPVLKKKYKELIIGSIKLDDMTISIIDLTKMKSTNKRMLKAISQQELVQYLYDVEVLGVKQWAIKQRIKSLLEDNNLDKIDLVAELTPEIIEARKQFRIDEKGVYQPLSVEKEETSLFEIYPAKVLEWKVEKFPKKKEQTMYLKEYEELVANEKDAMRIYEILSKELKAVQLEKRKKEEKINLVRISSALINKPIILWEDEISKSKTITDKTLNMNMIVNGEIKVSTKEINGVEVREDKYTMLVKAN